MSYIFISYSHKDKNYVHKIYRELLDKGFEVWIDDPIEYGASWSMIIQEKIDNCDAFIVIMTENASKSRSVRNEVRYAIQKQKKIIPLLLQGNPFFALEMYNYVDVTNGELPTVDFYHELGAKVTSRYREPAPMAAPPPKAPPPFRLVGIYTLIALTILVIGLIISLVSFSSTNEPAANPPLSPSPSIWSQIAIVAGGLVAASILSLIPTIAAKFVGASNRFKLSATEIFLFAIAIFSIASILFGSANNIGWILFATFTIAFLDIGAHLIDWIRESTFRRVDKTWQYKSLREDTASFDKLYNFERILYAAVPIGILIGTFIGVIQNLDETEIAKKSVQAITLSAFLILVFITFKSFRLMIVPMYNLPNPPDQQPIFTSKQREGAKSKEEKRLALAIMSTDLRKLYLYDSTHNILLMFLFAYSFLATYGLSVEPMALVVAIMLATISFSQLPYVLGQYLLHQKTLEPFEGLPRAEVEEKIRKYAPLYPTFHFLGALFTSGTAGGLAYFLLDNFIKGLFN